MQQQNGIAAIAFNRRNNRLTHRQPMPLCHVGAVNGRRYFTKMPFHPRKCRALREGFTQSRFKARGWNQAGGAGLHPNRAAGVQNKQVFRRLFHLEKFQWPFL